MEQTTNTKKSYTQEELREFIRKDLVFDLLKTIKDKSNPILTAKKYPDLVGTNEKGDMDNSRIAYDGFSGMPYEGINMLLLASSQNKNNFSKSIWIDGKHAMMMGFKAEEIKGLQGVMVQRIKTMDTKNNTSLMQMAIRFLMSKMA